MKIKNLILLISCIHINAYAVQFEDVYGEWCFFEQEAEGNIVQEKIDISLNKDGTYLWKEGPFEQKGAWELSDNKIKMSNIGNHSIVDLKGDILTLHRISSQKYKKGKCDINSFSDMDITRFHNAASTGEIEVIHEYLKKGIDINIVDFNRKESALIKAAKFCQIETANLLIKNGANKDIKNEKGQSALDFAKSSGFHKGCDKLVEILQ